MSEGLVVFLHGVGSSGAMFAALAEQWAEQKPGLTLVAPDAPFAFDRGGPGRQWFSVSGVTPANRAGRIVQARASPSTGFWTL